MSGQLFDTLLGGVDDREETIPFNYVDSGLMLHLDITSLFFGLVAQYLEHCSHVIQLLVGDERFGLVTCRLLVVRSLQDLLDLTASKLLTSM